MQTPKKNVILHIGTPKTATSAIQLFLYENRAKLAENGVEYPYFEHNFPNNGWPLCRMFRDGQINELKEMISKSLSTENKTVLFSCEVFSNLSEQEIRLLLQIFADQGCEVKAIGYFRRQDNWIMSCYNNQVKLNGRIFQKLDDYISNKDFLSAASGINLIRWANTIGKEKFTLRVYEKQQLYKNDIIADFMQYLGFDDLSSFDIPAHRNNVSIGTDVAEYMRIFNSLHHLMEMPPGRDPVMQACMEYSKEHKDTWPYKALSPKARREIIQMFEKFSRYMAENFLGREDGRLFYDPLPKDDPNWQPFELKEEDIAKINHFIAKNCPHAFLDILKGIVAGLNSQHQVCIDSANKLLSSVADISSSSKLQSATEQLQQLQMQMEDVLKNTPKPEVNMWMK